MQHHICISFEGAIKHPECLTVGEGEDERPATMKEIREAIAEAKAKGYVVLPPCDNVDERGYCKGHKEHHGSSLADAGD
jgi:hypothetical protein